MSVRYNTVSLISTIKQTPSLGSSDLENRVGRVCFEVGTQNWAESNSVGQSGWRN